MAEKKSKFWPRFWTVVGFGILFGVIVGIISTTIWLFGIIIFRKPLKEAFGDLIGANEGVVATVGDDTNNGGRTDEEQEIEEMLLNNHAKDDIAEIEQNVTDIDADTTLTVEEVAEKCMSSVVSINVVGEYTYYGITQEGQSAGSGFIVGMDDEKLLIATNYHVVADELSVSVQFVDGESAEASVQGKKVSMDLAVLSVNIADIKPETLNAITVAELGDSDSLKVGQQVVAIGNALGYGQSVTTGVVSALNREVLVESGETGYFIQTDAAINPGNSGGALIDMNGKVIGINSNKLGGTTVEGIGYAIPISDARDIIEKLMDLEELVELPEDQQSYFGISGADVGSNLVTASGVKIPRGVYVAGVVPGASADVAGIKKGDIITEFEGNSIVSMDELKEYLAAYPGGSTVNITIKRYEDGQYNQYDISVKLQYKIDNMQN